MFHPFKAKKAQRITKLVIKVVDSVRQTGVIGGDSNGGKLDAFRHAYWMQSLGLCIGKKQAIKLGKAHERGNFLQFRQHKLEENALPDSVSCEMDLRNNEAGVNSIGRCHSKMTSKELQDVILNMIQSGELVIIKRDPEMNFLMCDGSSIDMKKWSGKWNIPKCLVPSGQD
ncbi:MAG: DUF6973 domain-containing protein [Bacteroidia bacterium]